MKIRKVTAPKKRKPKSSPRKLAHAKRKARALAFLLGCLREVSSCRKCGYNKYPQVLEFHHRVPALRRFRVAASAWGRRWASIQNESCKCDLLCPNCHAEEHLEMEEEMREFI